MLYAAEITKKLIQLVKLHVKYFFYLVKVICWVSNQWPFLDKIKSYSIHKVNTCDVLILIERTCTELYVLRFFGPPIFSFSQYCMFAFSSLVFFFLFLDVSYIRLVPSPVYFCTTCSTFPVFLWQRLLLPKFTTLFSVSTLEFGFSGFMILL